MNQRISYHKCRRGDRIKNFKEERDSQNDRNGLSVIMLKNQLNLANKYLSITFPEHVHMNMCP